MNTFIQEKELNETQFVNVINELRKSHRDKWFAWIGVVNGKKVEIKVFNLFTQIFRINGIRYGGNEHKNVGNWIAELRQPFKTNKMERTNE